MFSQEYLKQLKKLHAAKDRPRGFGGKVKDLGAFHTYIKDWNPKTALDYGCGKGVILDYLKEQYPNTKWSGYDPAVLEYSKIFDQPFDMVFCNDVLEHIEPLWLDTVLENIYNLSNSYIWLRIDTRPARKKLEDGRNAHLIIENIDWWNVQLKKVDWQVLYSNVNKKGKLDYAIKK